jgi:succinylglutamate desuccinylase
MQHDPLANGRRQVDVLRGERPGPTLIVVGGLHGNEPLGLTAACAAIGRLRDAGVRIAGEVVALAGNLRALASGRRYLARDLNRQWTADRLAAAHEAIIGAGRVDAETHEVVELAAELAGLLQRARGPVHVLDLHTTSASGVPFAVVGASAAHRAFATPFCLPGIMGLEQQLDGVLTQYLTALGCVTLAVEGGQSGSAEALAGLEAAVTIAVAAAGLATPEEMPGWRAARGLLAAARGDLPELIEVLARHEVGPDDDFRMEPGFANIQRVDADTLLARDRTGDIRAPCDGVVLLPLYQAEGSDGFFYGRAVPVKRRGSVAGGAGNPEVS